MSKNFKFLLFSFLVISIFQVSLTASAQQRSDKDVRRMFIYHFINYIEWPDEAENNNFKIAVLNDDKMYEVLDKQLNGAKRRGKKIVIEKIDENAALDEYQLVYISRNSSKLLKDIKEKTSKYNLLLVTDRNGLASKGSGINFREVGDKLKFEINMDEIEKRGLKVANQLKKVAIVI